MSGNSAFGVAGAILVTLGLLIFSACAVPLGPGYTVERQQFAARFVGGSLAQLHLRATYGLRNTGNRDLSFVEAAVPDEHSGGRQNLRVWVEGGEVSPAPAAEGGAPTVRIPFDPPWPQKQRRTLVLEYDLAPARPGQAALAVNDGSFHLRDATAFPVLLAPKGTFAKGGERSSEIRLVVRVPQDFRVFAAGREQSSLQQGGESEYRFRIGNEDLQTFVVAGRYHEQQIKTASGVVIFWTFAPLLAAPAQDAAARLAATFQTYRGAFGPLWKKPPPVRLVETPAQLTRESSGSEDAAGVALPAGALLNHAAFSSGVATGGFLDLAEHELAHTWFGESIVPRPEAAVTLGEALADYATVVAAEARGGEAERHSQAALRLRWFDESRKRAADKPLLRLEPRDPGEQRSLGYRKGALFFLALEDQYGKENVRRALAHLVGSLRGQQFGYAELLSALELETHQKLGEFFRLWLDQTGIPGEVRARYEVKE